MLKKYFLKTTYYILINFSLFSIIGAFLYKIYKLNNFSIILTIFLTETSIFIIPYFSKKFNLKFENYFSLTSPKSAFIFINKNKKEKLKKNILFIAYLLFFIIEIIILIKSGTKETIISPWEKISPIFFLLFFILNIILFLNIYFKKNKSLFLIILHFFLSFSIIAIIYRIAYGFDYFIHSASLDIIKEKGFINPKPFYYLGHYSLIIILNKITFIPISILNKFLVPVLSAIYFPIFLYYFSKEWLEKNNLILFTLPLFLLLPFSYFSISNPQNLAYFYLLLSVLSALPAKNSRFGLLILFSLASFSVHPLAGISALFYTLLIIIHYSKLNFKKQIYRIILILNGLALPLAFILTKNGFLNPSSFQKKEILNFLKSLFKLSNPHSENILPNFVYLYIFNLKFLLFALIIFGIILAFKHKKECSLIFLNLSLAISLLVSFFITKNMRFNNLIAYEQDNFNDRIIIIITIFLIPFFLLTFYRFGEKLLKENKLLIYISFIFLSFFISVSLYNSYPRFDHYYNSHGYSVSESDLEASKWIDENAREDYIVLANQEMSAASLKNFGFKKYFKNNIFYYPIPTGGELYQYYLKMIKKPNKKTAEEAANLTGVKTVYFVLNKYWWASDKIMREAKLDADILKTIDDKIYIFKYNFQ